MTKRPPRAGLAVWTLLLACMPSLHAQDRPDEQSFDIIERGRYLATAGDCTACHTSIGGKLFAGGRPLETPFGTLIAPNITPDPATGIGNWNSEEFVAALRDGIGHNGVHLYPAMPYTYYTRMSRGDVLAIRTYLQTVEPVHNAVQANQLPFPFNVRGTMAGWNALFFTRGEFRPTVGKSAQWNRGAYLVQGAEHCGMCHTPKNVLGGDEGSKPFQGYALQGWFAPNLTGDVRLGLGQWTIDDIVLYLKTGRNRYDIASGPMAEAVTDSTSHLQDDDLVAMATYLKDQAAGGTVAAAVAAESPVMKQGEAIYIDQCAACHTRSGEGIVGLFPRLSNAPLVQQGSAASLVHVVLEGSRAVATDAAPTGPAMPSFAWKLSDNQTAAVLTYIRNAWGNAAQPVSDADVTAARHGFERDPR